MVLQFDLVNYHVDSSRSITDVLVWVVALIKGLYFLGSLECLLFPPNVFTGNLVRKLCILNWKY